MFYEMIMTAGRVYRMLKCLHMCVCHLVTVNYYIRKYYPSVLHRGKKEIKIVFCFLENLSNLRDLISFHTEITFK